MTRRPCTQVRWTYELSDRGRFRSFDPMDACPHSSSARRRVDSIRSGSVAVILALSACGGSISSGASRPDASSDGGILQEHDLCRAGLELL